MRDAASGGARAVKGVPGLALRAADDADQPFLYSVYASTREQELAPLPWDDAQKEAFLRMQFAAQDRAYRESHPDATREVVLLDGRPTGRLYVERRDHDIAVIDIALLPEFRGRGIGTALLRAVLAEGGRSGRPVEMHVERINPAQRLYRRLGFELVADGEVYLLMRWTPT